MTLLDHALAWHAAGYTPVPITTDGQKRPLGRWAHLQDTQPTETDVRSAFDHDTDGIGLICGGPTNLAMLEVEGRALHLATRISEVLNDHGHGDLWQRISSGYVEASPSGGIHWYYRVTDGSAAPNTRLARNADRDVLIETRGAGGFTIIAPSAGRTHPTGKPWTVLTGDHTSVATITADEQDALLALIATLDETPPVAAPEAHIPAFGATKGTRPGDDYNQRATWGDILTPLGWTRTKHFGGTTYGWTRPGKTARDGISATTGRNDGDNLYVFSSSTEFEIETPYSKFAAYCLLHHQGDWSAAAKQLAKDGYGTPPPLSPPAAPAPPPSTPAPPPSTPAPAAPPKGTGTDGHTPEPVSSVDARPLDANGVGTHYGPTEDGTARALVHLHKDRLRYCPQRGQWLTWTGSRWEWDTGEHHRELIRNIARTLPDGEGWASYKRRALSAAGVTGIARLAQSDAHVTVHIDHLDARPYELNTPGGIVDLRTGTLRPAEPSALHTRTTEVTPDYDRASDLLQTFLRTTFGDDPKLIAYVQQILGIATIGTVLEQILPFGFGSGANGKSTLLDATQHALRTGEEGYAISAPSEMLMVRKHSEHPAEVAQLSGARLVVCSELEEGARFAESKVKLLTGGDSINARFMRRDPFTFRPSHTFFLLGNSKPQAATGGHAFYRRVRLIPFEHVVPEEQRDPRLPEKLQEDAPALLAWITQGAAAYLSGGLSTPAHVTEATAEYASEQDTVGRFVTERCEVGPGLAVTARELRAAYEQWCMETGEHPASAKRLAQDLTTHGAEPFQSNGMRKYRGIELIQHEESGTRETPFGDLGGGSW